MTQMRHFDLLVLRIYFMHMPVPVYDEGIGILAPMHIAESIWGETERLLCANFKFITNIKFYMKLK